MGLKDQQPITDEDFVGRTDRNLTGGLLNNESFVNVDIINQEQNDTNIISLAEGSGNNFSLVKLIPKVNISRGWNLLGYTLPYETDVPIALFSIFVPKAFSIQRLANHLLSNGDIPNNIIDYGVPIITSLNSSIEGTLSKEIQTLYPNLYNEIVDKSIHEINNNNLIVFKSSKGEAYLPEYGYNGIGNLTPGTSYKIKITKNFPYFQFFNIQSNKFNINNENDYINSQNNIPFDIQSGWNLISYNRLTERNIEQTLTDVTINGFASEIDHPSRKLGTITIEIPLNSDDSFIVYLNDSLFPNLLPFNLIKFDIQGIKYQMTFLNFQPTSTIECECTNFKQNDDPWYSPNVPVFDGTIPSFIDIIPNQNGSIIINLTTKLIIGVGVNFTTLFNQTSPKPRFLFPSTNSKGFISVSFPDNLNIITDTLLLCPNISSILDQIPDNDIIVNENNQSIFTASTYKINQITPSSYYTQGIVNNTNITGSIEFIKHNNGDTYTPNQGYNTIGNFIPGIGYELKSHSEIKGFLFPPDELKETSSLIEKVESNLILNSNIENILIS